MNEETRKKVVDMLWNMNQEEDISYEAYSELFDFIDNLANKN